MRDSGACCPGLIEALMYSRRETSVRLDSGACCPGLIEACVDARHSDEKSWDSGACCPGLIEAMAARCFSAASSAGIPGLAALASLKLGPLG